MSNHSWLGKRAQRGGETQSTGLGLSASRACLPPSAFQQQSLVVGVPGLSSSQPVPEANLWVSDLSLVLKISEIFLAPSEVKEEAEVGRSEEGWRWYTKEGPKPGRGCEVFSAPVTSLVIWARGSLPHSVTVI